MLGLKENTTSLLRDGGLAPNVLSSKPASGQPDITVFSCRFNGKLRRPLFLLAGFLRSCDFLEEISSKHNHLHIDSIYSLAVGFTLKLACISVCTSSCY